MPIGLAYAPQTGRLATVVNGQEVISVPAATVVAAPAEVAIGENLSDMGLTHRRFTGVLRTLSKRVSED